MADNPEIQEYDEAHQVEAAQNRRYYESCELYSGMLLEDELEVDINSFLEKDEHYDPRDSSNLRRLLESVSDDYRDRILGFVSGVLGKIPDDVLTNNSPNSQDELAGLIASIYLRQKDENPNVDKEMYIRILKSIRMHLYTVGKSQQVNTLRYIDQYFFENEDGNFYDGWDKRSALGNMLSKLIIATIPLDIYGGEKDIVEEKYRQYSEFQTAVKEEIDRYRGTLSEVVSEESSERMARVDTNLHPVFTSRIEGYPPVTNIGSIQEMAPYISGTPGALTSGIDPVTGLNFTFTRVYTHNFKNLERPEDSEHRSRNIIYELGRTVIHEDIHQLGELDFNGFFYTQINELLTDSLAEHVQLLSYGETFTDAEFKNRHQTGYSRLVRWARDMIDAGIITQVDLNRLAINQDPEGLVNMIVSYAQGNVENALQVVNTMRRNMFVLPIKSDQAIELAVELSNNPLEVLQRHFLEANAKLGNGLIMNQYSKLSLFHYVKDNHPEYLERMRLVFAEKKGVDPNKIQVEKGYFLVDDPDNDGIFADEVVDFLFELINSSTASTTSSGYRINSTDIQEYLIQADSFVSPFSPNGLNEELDISKLDLEETTDLILGLEKLLEKGLRYSSHLPRDKKLLLDIIIPLVESAYNRTSRIIMDSYNELSPSELRDVTILLLTSTVRDISLKDSTRVSQGPSPWEILEDFLARIKILSNSGISSKQLIQLASNIEIPQDQVDYVIAEMHSDPDA